LTEIPVVDIVSYIRRKDGGKLEDITIIFILNTYIQEKNRDKISKK